ncbi:hypothetical protein HDU91_002170, partial [Kappamyces sp. JEL0680]
MKAKLSFSNNSRTQKGLLSRPASSGRAQSTSESVKSLATSRVSTPKSILKSTGAASEHGSAKEESKPVKNAPLSLDEISLIAACRSGNVDHV